MLGLCLVVSTFGTLVINEQGLNKLLLGVGGKVVTNGLKVKLNFLDIDDPYPLPSGLCVFWHTLSFSVVNLKGG